MQISKSDTFRHKQHGVQQIQHNSRKPDTPLGYRGLAVNASTIDLLSSFLPLHILAATTLHNGGTRSAFDGPPQHSSGATRIEVATFSDWVFSLNIRQVTAWLTHKLNHKWLLPGLIECLFGLPHEDWLTTPFTSNGNETQHHWTNSQTGIGLNSRECILRFDPTLLRYTHQYSVGRRRLTMPWANIPVEPDIQSGNLDVDGGVMSMGDPDIVVPPIISGKSSGTRKGMQGQLKLKKLLLRAQVRGMIRVNRNKGTHPVRALIWSLRRFLMHILEPGSSTFEVKVVPIDMRSTRVSWVDITKIFGLKLTVNYKSSPRGRVLQPTTLGQLGDHRISDQLSHQFDLKSVQGNDSGVESLACVGIDENPVNLWDFLSCVGYVEGSLVIRVLFWVATKRWCELAVRWRGGAAGRCDG
ncbi:hypothetical protein DFH08DRAFT_1034034 [Mycena albidolilacea]|uniref:Uncharacterized protein n=1 Tax=Mycena albidolilacea TaxID=1033008 RepID=A0AAD6ZF51_9AGAR|nr:hypothetical protein DFH08DRAFT_1034034 [Mycena albidolilacea]